jgi:archaeal type IV pilus assembly protein PilA
MWTERARSWRKKGKRAVSPIIATILLVAITVVLAAVLYILISGLTKGPGNTPLGTAFAWGPANNVTGTVAIGCTAGHSCYSMEILPSGSIQANALSFSLRTTAGAAAAFHAGAIVTVVGVNGQATGAVWTAASNSWTAGTTPLVSGETVVIDNGNAVGGAPTGSGLFGYNVQAVGQGTYQGEVTSNALS